MLSTYANGRRVASDMFNRGGLYAGHKEFRYDTDGKEISEQRYNAKGQKFDKIAGWV